MQASAHAFRPRPATRSGLSHLGSTAWALAFTSGQFDALLMAALLQLDQMFLETRVRKAIAVRYHDRHCPDLSPATPISGAVEGQSGAGASWVSRPDTLLPELLDLKQRLRTPIPRPSHDIG